MMGKNFAKTCIGAFCGVALGLSGLITQAIAQQNVEERRACGPDAVRLCREFVPNQDLINKCLFGKKAELTPACRTVMFGTEPATPTAATPATPAKQHAAKPEKPRVIKVRARKHDHD